MPKKRPAVEGNLDGLGSRLESQPEIRQRGLANGTFLAWSSPQAAGLMSLENLALNAKLMAEVVSSWSHQFEKPKTVNVDMLKEQAPTPSKSCFGWGLAGVMLRTFPDR